jgi:hypothetical protein
MKSVLAILLMFLSWTSFAAEPFTIMLGKDAASPQQPQACVGPEGSVHVAFGVGDQVYHCIIKGESSSVPSRAFDVPNMSLGMRRGPRIARSGNAIVITAIGGTLGKGRDGDVVAYRSTDHGKSWLGPVKVNDVDASAREGLHAMASSEEGTLWCVWLDLREKGTQLYASKSDDQGATWSGNTLVYRSPAGSICECCHPSIVAGKHSLHILFRNSLKGNRDMYLVSSNDHGKTFESAVRLGAGFWTLNACPMDGGMLAIDRNEKVSSVWRRDRQIFSASTETHSETSLGQGEQPWIAGSEDGFYSVWTTRRDGDLFLMKPESAKGEKVSNNSSFPIVIASEHAKSGVYLIWEKRFDQGLGIVAQRIR